MARSIFHLPEARVSIGIRVMKDGTIYLASSACHPNDIFRKKVAYNCLNGRLDNPERKVRNAAGDLVDYPFAVKLKTKVDVKSIKSLPHEVYNPIHDMVRGVSNLMRRVSTDNLLAPAKLRRDLWTIRSNLVDLKKLASCVDNHLAAAKDATPRPPKAPVVKPVVLPPLPRELADVQANPSCPNSDNASPFFGNDDIEEAARRLAGIADMSDYQGGC